jgi:hypothetical protein
LGNGNALGLAFHGRWPLGNGECQRGENNGSNDSEKNVQAGAAVGIY